MKTIEITPEWVLNELPHMHVADGNGNMSFYTDSVTDVRWITLALNTLGIEFQEYDEGDKDFIFFWFEVVIEDFKKHCPELFEKWMKLNEREKIDGTVNGTFNRFFSENCEALNKSKGQLFASLKWHLEQFCSDQGKSFCWESLEEQYDIDFENYLFDKKKTKSFIRKTIKAKREFLRWCEENPYLNSIPNKNAA